MSFAALIFSGWKWFWPLLAAVGVASALLFWNYRSATAGPWRWICLGLKWLGILALALCLLEPLWTGQRARPGANLFAIVADNSQGMQITDRSASRSRADLLRDLLNPQQGRWQATLEENFDVRRYLFDARLQTTKDYRELSFDGRSSAIGGSLRTLAERYHGRPLAGIILLTDGNATDLRAAPTIEGLPPVYPVVLGTPEAIRDIAVRQASVSQSEFEDAPVSVQADVAVTGFPGEEIVAQVVDRGGQSVSQQTLRAHGNTDTLAFRFRFRPRTAGLSFYQLRVRTRGELDAGEKTTEATLANNHSVLVVNRGRGPYRILYLSGRPNWEFKFLNRAVQEDEQLQLVGLIRVARREPKFNFIGRAGETSNPLFRGFDKQSPEDVERYDQPVLVRLNTRDQVELRAGFPRTPEDLYAYSALILDDLEAEFFSADQAALIQKFVAERGGGFLMLGGMESFQQGNYLRTPIGDMLPVYLDRIDDLRPPGPIRLNLTTEGFLQSWARLRDNETDEKTRIQSMAPFQVLNRVREVKPGASVIATVTDDSGKPWPAVVVQRFGRGRTSAVTLGDVWHWGLHDADAHRDMDKAWRQLMRWLITDVPARVELAVEPSEKENGAVTLQVRARDPKFQPVDNANVTLTIEPAAETLGPGNPTNAILLHAEPAENEAGLYQLTYVPRSTGGYKATALVTNSVGEEVGRAEAGWNTDLAAEEFRSLTPNVALLEAIARNTGGEVIRAQNLDEFARSLPNKRAPVMEAWTSPVWNQPATFAFALACLVGEWGIRRWKGLP